MLVARSMHPTWLSNSWLLADRPGGEAVLIDTGGPMGPIEQALGEHKLQLTRVLCTHHHYDHVDHNEDYIRAYGCPVCAHAAEIALIPGGDTKLADGEEVAVGSLTLRAIHIPGHTSGQLAFALDDRAVFTGDTLFRGSVGGTRAPDHTHFEDLHHSIMEVLFELPKEMTIYPGHMESSTLATEWECNPFVRAWRGLDDRRHDPVWAFGEPAELLLEARDYDGGTKCWVRFEESSRLDVVPGSRVQPR
ncbi:MAG: MBL fold metallo-hydrolase [Planctomycetes bacterium]|nr:MBL fold metallo-hydrolase [Planctomycetota bacterium]